MITLMADKILIRGPRVDGTWTISFEIGEYEKPKLAPLMMMENDKNYKITVEECDE